MPAVSVIMTSYNHEAYLCESIESVLSQTFDDMELIIIDDGSRDGSVKIIEQFADKHLQIRAMYHSENKGIAKTLNEALEAAGGQYIAIASSDDVWVGDKLARQMEVLNRDSDLIVWSDAYIIDEKGRDSGLLWSRRYRTAEKKKSGDIFIELLWGNFICPQTLILSKKTADSVRFDPAINYAVDYRFLIDVSKKYEFFYIDEPLVKYRVHRDNTIQRDSELWRKDMFRIFRDEIRRDGEQLPGKLRARLLSRVGRYHLSRRRYRLARHYLQLAVKQDFSNFTYLRNLLRACVKTGSERPRRERNFLSKV
jgi:glycosyltransferase involved in cell wall biosynthesis